MKRFLVLLLLLSHFSIFLQAEYVIFMHKWGGEITGITEREYKKVYQLLMHYTWPTSIAHADIVVNAIAKSKIHPVNEEAFLKRELEKINPFLDIAFIPTTLYEIFCLYAIEKGIIAKNKLPSDIFRSSFFDDKLLQIINDKSKSIRDIFSFYDEINNNPELINASLIINNALIEILASILENKDIQLSRSTTLFDIIKLNCFGIKNQLFKELEASKIYKSRAFLAALNQKHDFNYLGEDPEKDFFARTMQLEYIVHNQHAGLLYRGLRPLDAYNPLTRTTNPIIDSLLYVQYGRNEYDTLLQTYAELTQNKSSAAKKLSSFINFSANVSASFGNSLLAGIYYDDGACSLFHYYDPVNIGYALMIDKRAYLKGIAAQMKKMQSTSIESNILRIAPLNTLMALVAQGEFFHSRSKVFVPQKTITPLKETEGFEFKGLAISEKVKDEIGYLMSRGSPISAAAYFAQLIGTPQFCHIMKLNTPKGWEALPKFDLSSQDQKIEIKKLFANQGRYAQILKSLAVFEKFYRILLVKHPQLEPTSWQPTENEREQLKKTMQKLMQQLKISR